MQHKTLSQQTHSLLLRLPQTLQSAGLWSEVSPSEEALASQAPFACDCMGLEQWLQFIFLPRMLDIIQQGQALPQQLCILPVAEQVFTQHPEAKDLLELLASLDALFQESNG